MTVDDWDAVMNVHLRGAFLMSRAVQKHMVDARFGRIVNLSSTSALGNRGQVNYSAAKAGLQGFTKTLAIELGKFGVTANAIAPGFIETDMTAATAERVGVGFEDFKEAAASQIPVNRVGQPEDIADTASFLASEGAGFVSGQVIYVAGGPRGLRNMTTDEQAIARDLRGRVATLVEQNDLSDPAGFLGPASTPASPGCTSRPGRGGLGLPAQLPGAGRRRARGRRSARTTTRAASASAWAWPRRPSSRFGTEEQTAAVPAADC